MDTKAGGKFIGGGRGVALVGLVGPDQLPRDLIVVVIVAADVNVVVEVVPVDDGAGVVDPVHSPRVGETQEAIIRGAVADIHDRVTRIHLIQKDAGVRTVAPVVVDLKDIGCREVVPGAGVALAGGVISNPGLLVGAGRVTSQQKAALAVADQYNTRPRVIALRRASGEHRVRRQNTRRNVRVPARSLVGVGSAQPLPGLVIVNIAPCGVYMGDESIIACLPTRLPADVLIVIEHMVTLDGQIETRVMVFSRGTEEHIVECTLGLLGIPQFRVEEVIQRIGGQFVRISPVNQEVLVVDGAQDAVLPGELVILAVAVAAVI